MKAMNILDSELPDGPLADEILRTQNELQQFINDQLYLDEFQALINMPSSEQLILSGTYIALKAADPDHVYEYLEIPLDEDLSYLAEIILDFGTKSLQHYYDEIKARMRHILYWYLDYYSYIPTKEPSYPSPSDEEVYEFCRSLSPEQQIEPGTFSREELLFLGSIISIHEMLNKNRFRLNLHKRDVRRMQSMFNDISNENRVKTMRALKTKISSYITTFTDAALPSPVLP